MVARLRPQMTSVWPVLPDIALPDPDGHGAPGVAGPLVSTALKISNEKTCVVRPDPVAPACVSLDASPKPLLLLTITGHVPERFSVPAMVVARKVNVAVWPSAMSSPVPGPL